DDTPDANDFAGTGFIDGLEILSASLVVQDNGQFEVAGSGVLDTDLNGGGPAGASVHGSGTLNVEALVHTPNNDLLDLNPTVLGGAQLRMTLSPSPLELPFGPADPAQQFEVVGGIPVIPDPGLINGVVGPDFIFEADANQVFDVRLDVPEPASAALALIGL